MLRLFFSFLLGCLWLPLPARAATPDDTRAIVAQIEQARVAKDSLLRQAPDSPLPPQARDHFKGLGYFPVDLRFRLIGDLHRYGRRQLVEVPTSAGTSLSMEKFGRLHCLLSEKSLELEVYRSPENEELVVFFKDQTNGHQTYAGGRYVPVARLGNGRYLLDFNMAYNPYCAYNSDYVCPLPPVQNYLPLAIQAGEKATGPDLAH